MTTILEFPVRRSVATAPIVPRSVVWRSARPALIRHAWVQSESSLPATLRRAA
jgi:hypothetical protein